MVQDEGHGINANFTIRKLWTVDVGRRVGDGSRRELKEWLF